MVSDSTTTGPTGNGGSRGLVRLDTPCDGVWRLRVTGTLDPHTAARIVRCVDARLQLVDAGYHPTRHMLIDLTEVVTAVPAGLRALPHARYSAGRRGITVHLVGADHLATTLAPNGSAPLRTFGGGFPDLPAALTALHPRCERCAAT